MSDLTTAGGDIPDSSPSPATLGVAGRFLLRAEIARGGMGVVYAALDPRIGREVAVKVLHLRLRGQANSVRRFDDESHITGQLQHPGIPAVYEIGRLDDGRPFLAMKLIKGCTLAERIADGPAARAKLLGTFEQLCQAVAYAHSHRIIHRDLKPSNIMVGAFGEVQVMDWGLAKVLGANPRSAVIDPGFTHDDSSGPQDGITCQDSSQTQAGAMLGTPAYMPPEQAMGAVALIDERADVFGLGAVLCAVLTGKPPYDGKDGEEVRLQAVRGLLDEAYARLEASGADPGLVALARRCLAPDLADRPRDAGVVAAEVKAWRLAAEERARQAELERARAELASVERGKRLRVWMALAGSLVALAAVAGAAGWWIHVRTLAAEAESSARRERTTASVRAALEDARLRTKEAWDHLAQPTTMRLVANQALEAFRRAEGFAASGEPTPEVAAELAMTRAAVNDLDRHARFLVDAEEALFAHAKKRDSNLSMRLLDLFRRFGWDVIADPTERLANAIVASRARDKVLGLLSDLEFQMAGTHPKPRPTVTTLIRTARQKAGGALARWQLVLDSGDRAGLVRFAREVEPRDLGPELVAALGRDLGSGERVELLRRGVRAYPAHLWLRFDLMYDTKFSHRFESLRHAAALRAFRPDSELFAYHVASCLAQTGALDDAIAEFREATAMDPRFLDAHLGLGSALRDKGDLPGAVAAFEEATRCTPGSSYAWDVLGDARSRKRDYRGAADAFREETRVVPSYPRAHINLGNALRQAGETDRSIAAHSVALRLAPANGYACEGLGLAYLERGDLRRAAETLDKAARLLPNGHPTIQSSRQRAKRLVELDARLPAVRSGAERPATPAEAIEFAQLAASTSKRDFALAHRLSASLIEADTPFALRRYNAARMAVRLAAGDDPAAQPSPMQVLALRRQAATWLGTRLAAVRAQGASANPVERRRAAEAFKQWLADRDFASVRDPAPLAAMPPDERRCWEALWADLAKGAGR